MSWRYDFPKELKLFILVYYISRPTSPLRKDPSIAKIYDLTIFRKRTARCTHSKSGWEK